ncbi:hypothetical protein CEUSTIGMA_g12185.t1 [Chlamydomonas eustigma]|uniref:Uncharacterized protein n=1 Tax=Chlamydomonas eustigma TaxID=1157962 RepID=A0A250XP35_9CHLO|nr:hypothetical protein CEUSTIGMA_g12185.t1 [Chlamydomonas eustigma]|eukprot:GAX84763.1 hypothetical protein CEUSTIGMA_g12185.t1 [Chlamydomonas eustigma]
MEANIDIVVAHFREDLGWLSEAHAAIQERFLARVRLFVYHKGGQDIAGVKALCPPGADVSPLPNVGRESDTYLHHLIRMKDDAENAAASDSLVLCCQGCLKQHIAYERFSSTTDYLCSLIEDARTSQSGRSEATARAHILGPHSATRAFKIHQWGEKLYPSNTTFGEWFERLVGPFPDAILPAGWPEALRLRWWAGANFCVKAGLIYARQKDFFQAIRDTVSVNVNPEAGHFVERAWFYILAPSRSKVRMLTSTSPNYKPLFDVFMGTLRPEANNIDLRVLQLEPKARGTFRTQGWQLALQAKIEFVCRELAAASEEPDDGYNRWLVVSDADIQFFAPWRIMDLIEQAKTLGIQFYGMTEGGLHAQTQPQQTLQFNGGFYVIRSCPAITSLFMDVLATLRTTPFGPSYPAFGDQTVLNELMPKSGVRYGHLDVVRVLLEWPVNAARANCQDGLALLYAARDGHLEIVRLLLEWPVNAARANCLRGQALVYAASNGHLDVVRLLLERPEHAPRADCQNGQALVYAARYGHLDVVRVLLEWPEHAPRADCQDCQALVFATRNGHITVVHMLRQFM